MLSGKSEKSPPLWFAYPTEVMLRPLWNLGFGLKFITRNGRAIQHTGPRAQTMSEEHHSRPRPAFVPTQTLAPSPIKINAPPPCK